MASTLPDTAHTAAEEDRLHLAIYEEDFEEALEDPRVRALHDRADELVRQLHADGRNL
jgi:hypothetical protein